MLSSPRQHPRPESVHSWWSDSNPMGPNINLHAATKPLLRRMHDRQALGLIRKNRGTPLSSRDVEIYTSYLWFKYVSPSTKAAITREIYQRIHSEEEDARTVANSLALYHVDAMLESPNDEFRTDCWIFIRDNNVEVVASGVYALYCLATWQGGAQALVDAGVLECTKTLLGSGKVSIRRWTCGMLARLLQRPPTLADSVVKLSTSSLCDEPFHDTALELMESAAHALFWSIRFPEVPQEEILLDCLSDLLKSRNLKVRKWTCKILGDLACQESSATAVLSVIPCPQLVSLLRDTHIEVIESAQAVVDAKVLDWVVEQHGTRNLEWPRRMLENVLSHTLDTSHCKRLASSELQDQYLEVMTRVVRTLSKIAVSPEGALAVVNAKVLDRVAELFESPNTDIRRWACQLLGAVGSHKKLLLPIFARTPFDKLVELLRDDNDEAVESAVCALFRIAALSEAMQAMVDARVLDCTAELLDSPSPDVRRWTCRLLRQLAGHQTTVADVLAINPCEQIVPCLHNQNVHVVRRAAETLHWIGCRHK
ncbi:armadillo-type protein [Mycena vulgaris]|nr:armadillo-type protein [Mycena vulgaris]